VFTDNADATVTPFVASVYIDRLETCVDRDDFDIIWPDKSNRMSSAYRNQFVRWALILTTAILSYFIF